MRLIPLLLLLAAACGREWVREYDGTVPGTWEANTTILLVWDRLTGRPVQGAIVRQRPENHMGRDGRWAPLVAEGRTDEFGLATFRLPDTPPISHWTVHAEGYAPTETYGQVVDEDIDLGPGTDYVGRLLAIDGSPLAGAVVEWKTGCAHSPPLAVARTDESGFFRFGGIEDGDFVVDDPRGAAEYMRGPRGPGFGIPVEQLFPGRTVRGRVVTSDGSPPEWAVVATGARAPRAATDPDGRFTLRGFTRGALEVWWDGPWMQTKDDFAPGLEALLVVGRPSVEPRPVTVRVHVRGENGQPPPDPLRIHFDRLASGRRLSFDWDPEHPDVRIPLGTYSVSAGSPRSSHVAPARRFDLRAHRDIEIVLRRQPTLHLPALPEEATARVVLEDDCWVVNAGEPAYLPATAPAWLRVDLGPTPYTFPIGPERDGVRAADARLPGRKFIRIAGLEAGLKAELIGEDSAIADGPEAGGIVTGSAGLATYAVGARWLQLAHQDKGWAVVGLDLPFEAATIEPDCTLTPWPEPVELRVLLDDGAPVEGANVTVLDGEVEPKGCMVLLDEPSETDARGVLRHRWLRDGLHLRIDREDGVPSWARLRGGPPYEVRLGTATLEIDIRGVERAGAVLDGLSWGPEEERISFRGLSAGPHTLLVGSEGRKPLAYRLVLREGETRRIRPDLRPRR